MKMEAKILQINLQPLYIYEQDLYMNSCRPEYVQSLFVARANEFEPAKESAGDAGRSPPKVSSPKKLVAKGEPIAEGEPNGDSNQSLPRADQSGQDAGASKGKPFDIEDSPEMEKVFTYATAPEGHTVQINC